MNNMHFRLHGNRYSSRYIAVDMAWCLAGSTRYFWLPRIQRSPRGSLITDETGDRAHRTQLCTMYKILLEDMEPVLVYAGLEDLPRGNSEMIWAALKHRLELDDIELETWLAMSCYDTCNVMHG